MILRSLFELYDRLKDDTDYEIAPPGYSLQKISFKVVLRPNGILFDIQDMRQDRRTRQIRVLGEAKPSGSGMNPCFLWDSMGYMLGHDPGGEKADRVLATFDAFRRRHLGYEKNIGSHAYSAVCRFLESWSPDAAAQFPILSELKTGFGVFQIVGETAYVHQDAKVDSWWQGHIGEGGKKGPLGQCLLTGEYSEIAQLQPMIRGVAGGNAQAPLVGFNDKAYESYGKEQALNAPVSQQAALKYGAALNALLDGPMRAKHRFILGDATVGFWTDRPSIAEDIFVPFAQHGDILDSSFSVQDEGMRKKVEIFLRAIRQGTVAYGDLDSDPLGTKYYLLALSPNVGRLSVRFFYSNSIQRLLENLSKHYHDTGIEKQYGDRGKHREPDLPPIWMLLSQTAREAKDIPPLLAGPLLRSILTGSPYPDGLYHAVIRRIYADHEINYIRAGIIKGWLARNLRQEVTMSLDLERKDPAYRMGRLFAALEKTQSDALEGIKATIRDRFYSAASATPGSVFPRILRNYQHHLAKLDGGFRVNREKLIQEIVEPLAEFPAHLNLAEQGLFALGYYHQTQEFYRRKVKELGNES